MSRCISRKKKRITSVLPKRQVHANAVLPWWSTFSILPSYCSRVLMIARLWRAFSINITRISGVWPVSGSWQFAFTPASRSSLNWRFRSAWTASISIRDLLDFGGHVWWKPFFNSVRIFQLCVILFRFSFASSNSYVRCKFLVQCFSSTPNDNDFDFTNF